MQLDGPELLALWREAGEWWAGEYPREIKRIRDQRGRLKEEITLLRLPEEEPSDVKIRQLRDEKVQLASGRVIAVSLGGSRKKSKAALLHALSGYALGRGTMIAAEIPALAAEQGYGAALLADPFSLTGAFEFYKTAQDVGIKALIGAAMELSEGGEIVLIAESAEGYRSLSRLITECHQEEPRLYPLCTWERLKRHSNGLICLSGGSGGPIDRLLIRRDYQGADEVLGRLIDLYGQSRVCLQIERSYQPWSLAVEKRLLELAEQKRVLPVAGGPVLFHRPSHYTAQDALACIDSLCLVEEIEGRKPRRASPQNQPPLPPRRELNCERHLRTLPELSELYADRPDLLRNAWKVAEWCDSNVMPGRSEPPSFAANENQLLREIALVGARMRYPRLTKELKSRLDRELNIICQLDYARHFLIAWDMCNWAVGEGILLSGRGSVVDSCIAYSLGLTRVDALEFDLHFERFLPPDGSKRPDIDIDFEAARREDVRQYLVGRYGADHVATVAAIGTFGSRGIIREVGKVMGIPQESIGYLTKRLHGAVTPERLETALNDRPELRDSGIPKERFYWAFRLAERLMDLPRGLRAHSSGVVISEQPIADLVPVVSSGVDCVQIMQWDKRSAKHCFDKFDVLCLRGNDVLSRTVKHSSTPLDVTDIPLDDPEVYRTMRSGELIGIPQSASPAMRQAHIRIGTRTLKDAGIVQAGIRPGVGGAVKLNEYVARRNGKPFNLIHQDLEKILGPTLGIVVFQEQIDLLLTKFANYTGDDAEEIREGIHKNRQDYAKKIHAKVTSAIIKNGYSSAVAEEVYQLVAGFKGYGFAEGHALAFAEVSIRSIWCQQNYPAPYFAALLDAQPAGYYGPATIANEARVRGVKVLPPCVNRSGENFAVEDHQSTEDPKITLPQSAIRVSLRQVAGLSQAVRERIIAGQPYGSLYDLILRAAPARDELEQLILCGGLDALNPNRRSLLWAIPEAMQWAHSCRRMSGALPLTFPEPITPQGIVDFTEIEKAIFERRILHLDVERHLMAFERERVREKGGVSSAEASRYLEGRKIFVVGNPIRLRFPPTQSGRRVMFFDLEDETGLLNVTCFDDIYQRDGHKVICNQYITLWGETQNRDGHIAFMASSIRAYEPMISRMSNQPAPLPLVTADFLMT